MMKTVQGDILKETEGIIVHGCNAQGVMGSGIAKQIRNKYPQVFKDYRDHYLLMIQTDPENLLGSIVITEINPKLIIVSGITQQFYGRDTNERYVCYNAVRGVFSGVRKLSLQTGLPVKYPALGSGLGGGDLERIKMVINEALKDLPEHTLFVQ